MTKKLASSIEFIWFWNSAYPESYHIDTIGSGPISIVGFSDPFSKTDRQGLLDYDFKDLIRIVKLVDQKKGEYGMFD